MAAGTESWRATRRLRGDAGHPWMANGPSWVLGGGRARLARRMPRRHDEHILDAMMSRRRRSDSSKATNPMTSSTPARPTLGRRTTRRRRGKTRSATSPSTTSNTSTAARPTLGTSNDSPPAWRDPPLNEPIDDFKHFDDGAGPTLGRRTTRRQRGETRSATSPSTTSNTSTTARDPPWDVERLAAGVARPVAQRARRQLQTLRRLRDPPWEVERLAASVARPAAQRPIDVDDGATHLGR
jgi:hypothetical protein